MDRGQKAVNWPIFNSSNKTSLPYLGVGKGIFNKVPEHYRIDVIKFKKAEQAIPAKYLHKPLRKPLRKSHNNIVMIDKWMQSKKKAIKPEIR